jgi:hypothetical protein
MIEARLTDNKRSPLTDDRDEKIDKRSKDGEISIPMVATFSRWDRNLISNCLGELLRDRESHYD